MITFTLLGAFDAPTGFICEGHAGYGDRGYDIVCAAVSALTITCVNALDSLTGATPKVSQMPQQGYLSVDCQGESNDSLHDTQLLLRALYLGIKDIAQQYPKHVMLSK